MSQISKKLFTSIQFIYIVILSISLQAQDLEPRFLSSTPIKTNFTGIVYGYSTGDVILNSQVVDNLNANLHSLIGFYGRSFKLLNKPAKLDVIGNYSFGNLNAFVEKVDSTVYKNGLSDPTVRLSMILIGDKPLTVKEFSKREIKKFKMGAAFKVKFPIGYYDETKLINFGANRWAFQFKLAASYLLTKKIVLEFHIDSWFYTKNTSFNNGNTLSQEPLLTSQLHIAYIFSPKFWASASIGQVALGETSLNGVKQEDNQENSRYGLTASYRLNKLGSLKFVVTNGLYTGNGADFTTFLLGYSFLWFDKNKITANE